MATGGSAWTRLVQRPSRALGFLLGLRLVLSLVGLREPTLWLDEASSLYVAGGPLAVGGPDAPPRLLDRLRLAENSPPLYFALLRLWGSLGTAEPWLRLLSVVFGLVAVAAVYALGLTLLPPGAALAGALLFAAAPFQIDASQSIRFYSLATAASAVAAAAGLGWLRRGGLARLAAHAAASAVALATLYPTGFALAAVSLVVAVDLLRARRWRDLAAWAGVQVVVALAFVPWLPLLLEQSGKVQEAFWARKPTLARVWFSLYPLAGGRPLAVALVVLGIAAVVGRRGSALRLVALLAVPIVLQATLAALGGPPFHGKYLVAAAPAAALLAGLGLTELRPPPLRTIVALALAALLARRLAGYYAGDFERFYRMRDLGLANALAAAAASKPAGTPLLHASVYSLLPARYYVPLAGPHVLVSPPLPHYLLGRAIGERERWGEDASEALAHERLELVVHPSYPWDARLALERQGFRVAEARLFGRPRPDQEFTPIRTYLLVRTAGREGPR